MRYASFTKMLNEIVSTLLLIIVLGWVINHFRQPEVEETLPLFEWTTLDKQSISTQLNGKPTVIHFWATWCPTCKLEAPNLETLKEEVNLITIAVNSGYDPEIQSFMEEHGYTYHVVNDNQGILAKRFNVGAFPTTFMYDNTGTLQFIEVGYSTTLGLKARVALLE